ncbi:MAG: hypothetical protein ABIO79_07115 [Ferruginibacter sp.]
MKKSFFFLAIFTTQSLIAQNIGIGITTPSANLHIRNGASGVTPFPSSQLAVESNVNTYVNLLAPTVNETAILFGQPGNAANGVIMYNNPATPNGFQFRNNGNLTRMTLASNGNMGIGLLSPSAKLSISATGTELAGSAASNIFRTHAGTLGSVAGDELSLASIGYASTNNSSLGIKAYRTAAGSDWTTSSLLLQHDVDNSPRVNGAYLALAPNGNIGIGTVLPAAKLHVSAGDASFALFGPNSFGGQLFVGAGYNQGVALTAQVISLDGNLYIDPAPGKNMYLGDFQGRDIYMNLNGGNVDIGGKLGIGISNNTPGFPLTFAQVTGDKISLFGNSGAHYGLGIQGYLMQIHTNDASADIAFGYGSSSSFTETMRIKGNGNMGIGTTTPTTKLEVNGYTKLGNDAPSIKVKKLTGTTASTEGGIIHIPHGLDASKILSVSVMISASFDTWYGPNSAGFGVNFYWFVIPNSGAVSVFNRTGDSVYLLSRPIKILITYEE